MKFSRHVKNYTITKLVLGSTKHAEPKLEVGYHVIVVPACLNNSKPCGDIAMIKLERDVIEVERNDYNIRPVCLPEPLTNPSNRTLTHIGWGVFEMGTRVRHHTLQMAVTQLFSEKYCNYLNDFANIGLGYHSRKDVWLCVQADDNRGCNVWLSI